MMGKQRLPICRLLLSPRALGLHLIIVFSDVQSSSPITYCLASRPDVLMLAKNKLQIPMNFLVQDLPYHHL